MQSAADLGDEDGVIMVDALVAVVIVSLMIAVCLGSLKIVRAFSATAADAKSASVTLSAVMESVPRLAGDYNGVSGDASYHARVTEELVQDIRLCRIDIAVRPSPKSRVYRLTGSRWCAEQMDAAA